MELVRKVLSTYVFYDSIEYFALAEDGSVIKGSVARSGRIFFKQAKPMKVLKFELSEDYLKVSLYEVRCSESTRGITRYFFVEEMKEIASEVYRVSRSVNIIKAYGGRDWVYTGDERKYIAIAMKRNDGSYVVRVFGPNRYKHVHVYAYHIETTDEIDKVIELLEKAKKLAEKLGREKLVELIEQAITEAKKR